MTTVSVRNATHDDIDALVTSVAGLFAEDGGQHDTSMNLDWPARDAATSSAPQSRPAPGSRLCR